MRQNDHTLRRLLHEARHIRAGLIGGCFLGFGSVLCAIAGPKLLGDLIDILYAFWQGERAGDVQAALVPGLLLLLVLYAGHSLMDFFKMRLLNTTVSRYFTCNLRIKLSEKIKKLPVRYVDQTPVGDILARMTDDIGNMGGSIHDIIDILTTGILQILAITVMMLAENWVLALLVLALTPFSIWLSTYLASKSEGSFHTMFEADGELTAVVEESYSNFATTKAYNLEGLRGQAHEAVNQKLRQAEEKSIFLESILQPVIAFTNSVAYIAVSLIGGWLLVKGSIDSVGVVVSLVLYARLFATPLEQIAGGLGRLQHTQAACRRVFAVLDMEEEPDPEGALQPERIQGEVCFDHVDFSYDEATPLISDLTIHVKKGQNVAIVGPTGAGKTTIVNLLMRFYDIQHGKITIDGQDLAEISRQSSRNLFGMVLQDTWLFRGTIAENVAYGRPDATREQIVDACRQAYCDHFIRTLPQGYDTVIGDDSTTISGGQKQLLTIARAILSDSRLLILDEATSNVDTRTELLIQKAMDNLMRGRTCFVIAHRLSTIVDSDLILVLDHGKIVEQGRHEELLAKKGFYWQIYNSQYAV